jgi:hypothetical protein
VETAPVTNSVEEIIDDIQALKESLEERISSIEDGSLSDGGPASQKPNLQRIANL